MKTEVILQHILLRRYWIAVWIAPVLILGFSCQWIAFPILTKIQSKQMEIAVLRENTYEKKWLDSTENQLNADVSLLQNFLNKRQAALTQSISIQALTDQMRNAAQASGISIVKTTPVVIASAPLKSLKIRLEGLTSYDDMMRFFARLNTDHSNFFLEELLLKSAGNKLETHFTLYTYFPAETSLP